MPQLQRTYLVVPRAFYFRRMHLVVSGEPKAILPLYLRPLLFLHIEVVLANEVELVNPQSVLIKLFATAKLPQHLLAARALSPLLNDVHYEHEPHLCEVPRLVR